MVIENVSRALAKSAARVDISTPRQLIAASERSSRVGGVNESCTPDPLCTSSMHESPQRKAQKEYEKQSQQQTNIYTQTP